MSLTQQDLLDDAAVIYRERREPSISRRFALRKYLNWTDDIAPSPKPLRIPNSLLVQTFVRKVRHGLDRR